MNKPSEVRIRARPKCSASTEEEVHLSWKTHSTIHSLSYQLPRKESFKRP